MITSMMLAGLLLSLWTKTVTMEMYYDYYTVNVLAIVLVKPYNVLASVLVEHYNVLASACVVIVQ